MFLAMVLVAGLACQFLPRSTACSRSIYEQGGKGASVVRAVVDKINRLGIFPNDRKFLCRIAWVESRYGIASGTFRPGYYGGIWQVDRIGHRETTTNPRLRRYWNQIKAKLGIDWTRTRWQHLLIPMYSGLAARLYLVRIPAPIPTSLASQAAYWKRYYNTAAGKGTVQKFINDVRRAPGCAKVKI